MSFGESDMMFFKPPPPRIDSNKIKELEFTRESYHLIKELKAGHEVTLPDGRVITPEQVRATEDESDGAKPNLLVVEVVSEEKLQCLVDSPLLDVSYYWGLLKS